MNEQRERRGCGFPSPSLPSKHYLFHALLEQDSSCSKLHLQHLPPPSNKPVRCHLASSRPHVHARCNWSRTPSWQGRQKGSRRRTFCPQYQHFCPAWLWATWLRPSSPCPGIKLERLCPWRFCIANPSICISDVNCCLLSLNYVGIWKLYIWIFRSSNGGVFFFFFLSKYTIESKRYPGWNITCHLLSHIISKSFLGIQWWTKVIFLNGDYSIVGGDKQSNNTFS